MRILVCGDRDWKDEAAVIRVLDEYLAEYGHDNLCIIQGDARGVDTMAKMWAEANEVDHESYPARWKIQGRSAGPQRNRRMLLLGVPDLVIAFHDDLENGKGTKDMVKAAKRHKTVKIRKVRHKR